MGENIAERVKKIPFEFARRPFSARQVAMIDGTVVSQSELHSASGPESALFSPSAGLFTDSDYRKFLEALARRGRPLCSFRNGWAITWYSRYCRRYSCESACLPEQLKPETLTQVLDYSVIKLTASRRAVGAALIRKSPDVPFTILFEGFCLKKFWPAKAAFRSVMTVYSCLTMQSTPRAALHTLKHQCLARGN